MNHNPNYLDRISTRCYSLSEVFGIPNTTYQTNEALEVFSIKVSMIQMDMQLGRPEENFAHAEQLVRTAARMEPDVITLPETWNVGFFPKENLAGLADRDCAQVKSLFSALARELKVNILAGSVANLRQDGKVYNTACVFDREGVLAAEYDKVHLFSPSGEHEYFQHGTQPCNFQLDGVPCSLVICYDIRFPELIRSEMLAGSKVQFVVAQWPDARHLHWDTLNRARAIEGQCFLSCTNSVGSAEGTRYGGHSAIYAPTGECVILGGTGEQILTADMDLSLVEGMRSSINVYRDRIPEAYRL